MSKKCQKEHVQISTNVEQMSPETCWISGACWAEIVRISVLRTWNATNDTSNNFFYHEKRQKIIIIYEVNARLDSS